MKSKKIEGGVLKIFWTCSNGHAGSGASSTVLCEKKGKKVYTNTVLLAAGVFLSSNSFEKIVMFCRNPNIGFIAPATFTRVQRLYIIPEVVNIWEQMQKDIWGVLAGENIILCAETEEWIHLVTVPNIVFIF